MGKEMELKEMIRTGRRKRIGVVRAKQERTGILYSDARTLNTPEDVLRTFGSLFENAGVEQMLAVALTCSREPVAVQIIGVGSVTSCQVSAAEILKLALLSNCPAVLLLHNHPSGSILPSSEDRKVTERIKRAGEIMEVELTDHVIIGDSGHGYSIRGEKEIYLGKAMEKRGA